MKSELDMYYGDCCGFEADTSMFLWYKARLWKILAAARVERVEFDDDAGTKSDRVLSPVVNLHHSAKGKFTRCAGERRSAGGSLGGSAAAVAAGTCNATLSQTQMTLFVFPRHTAVLRAWNPRMASFAVFTASVYLASPLTQ